MTVLPNIAGRAVDLAHNGIAGRSVVSNHNYTGAPTISSGIIAVIIVAVVIILCICVGSCCVHSRRQDRRRQRQQELNKWHKDHPNSGTYQYGNGDSAAPPAYVYGAGADMDTGVTHPGPAHTAGHHGAVDTSGGSSSGAGGHNIGTAL